MLIFELNITEIKKLLQVKKGLSENFRGFTSLTKEALQKNKKKIGRVLQKS